MLKFKPRPRRNRKTRSAQIDRTGGANKKSPAGLGSRHTRSSHKPTYVRTVTNEIRVGQTFRGTVPLRTGARTASFSILQIKGDKLYIDITGDREHVICWIDKIDLETAIVTGLARAIQTRK